MKVKGWVYTMPTRGNDGKFYELTAMDDPEVLGNKGNMAGTSGSHVRDFEGSDGFLPIVRMHIHEHALLLSVN